MTYKELVDKRKNYEVKISGFINPSEIDDGKYDTNEILEPFGNWHSKIPADILVVGQDWGGIDYYRKNKGHDLASNPTCRNLISLFNEIGINIGTPEKPNNLAKVHFTNIIPFIREGRMQGSKGINMNVKTIDMFALCFLKPLIEIVQPQIIIALGTKPFRGVCKAFEHPLITGKYSEIVNSSPYTIKDLKVYPMFHCGALSTNTNRSLDEQKSDWRKIIIS